MLVIAGTALALMVVGLLAVQLTAPLAQQAAPAGVSMGPGAAPAAGGELGAPAGAAERRRERVTKYLIECPVCYGDKYIDQARLKVCPRCKGKGKVEYVVQERRAKQTEERRRAEQKIAAEFNVKECPLCYGDKYLDIAKTKLCPRCKGKGTILVPKEKKRKLRVGLERPEAPMPEALTEEKVPPGKEEKAKAEAKEEVVKPKTPSPEQATTWPAEEKEGVQYIGNSNTKVFHLSTCPDVEKIKKENKATLGSREAAISAGFKPCEHCKP